MILKIPDETGDTKDIVGILLILEIVINAGRGLLFTKESEY